MNSLLMTQEELKDPIEQLQLTSENKSSGLLAKSLSLTYIIYGTFVYIIHISIDIEV